MNRLIVAFLAAVDAAIAVAVGLAATLAPLTVLWVLGLGGDADWGVLWPAGAAIWQLGNLVPLAVTLAPGYLAVTGIDPAAASFTLSLAPLAFAAFTAIFAARSGVRASRADAWVTGVATSTVVFGALTAGVALTARNAVVAPELWRAIVMPVLVFALPAVVAAVVTEWREAGGGAVARVRDRVESSAQGWAEVPGLVARGAAVVVVGLVGVGAAIAAVAVFARAGQIVALYQAGGVDAVGAVVLTIGQLAYAPTLAVWGAAFAAGPGFMVGAGTSVSPAGTQVGVIPGIPALGAVPESTTPWLLLLALAPIALGAFAGWIARSRLLGVGSAPRNDRERMPRLGAPARDEVARLDSARTAALDALLTGSAVRAAGSAGGSDGESPRRADAIAPRLVIAVGIAVASAAAFVLLAVAASGSLGPGRLAMIGPEPGPVALAVGAEVLLGAAILLLSPRSARDRAGAGAPEWAENRRRAPSSDAGADSSEPLVGSAPRHPSPPAEFSSGDASDARTEPIELGRTD